MCRRSEAEGAASKDLNCTSPRQESLTLLDHLRSNTTNEVNMRWPAYDCGSGVLEDTGTLTLTGVVLSWYHHRPQCNTEAAGISDPVCRLRSRDKGLQDGACACEIQD